MPARSGEEEVARRVRSIFLAIRPRSRGWCSTGSSLLTLEPGRGAGRRPDRCRRSRHRPFTYRKPRGWPLPALGADAWTRAGCDSSSTPSSSPTRLVHDAEVRAGTWASGSTRSSSPSILAEGAPRRLEGRRAPSRPTSGGSGRDGVAEALRRVRPRTGGRLVCLEDSTSFAIEEFGLPVLANVLKDLKSRPSSTRARLDLPSNWPGRSTRSAGQAELTVGMPGEFSAWFDNSPAFELSHKRALGRRPARQLRAKVDGDSYASAQHAGKRLAARPGEGPGQGGAGRVSPRDGADHPVRLLAPPPGPAPRDLPAPVQRPLPDRRPEIR